MTSLELSCGQFFNLEHPSLDSITFDNIVYHLAHMNRWNGGMGTYSVAEHSVLCARMAHDAGESPAQVLAVLMHDAHEHIVGDISRPMQEYLGTDFQAEFRILKNRIDALICEKFDISAALMHNTMTKFYDNCMLSIEAWHGTHSGGEHSEYHLPNVSDKAKERYKPQHLAPDTASSHFTMMFNRFHSARYE